VSVFAWKLGKSAEYDVNEMLAAPILKMDICTSCLCLNSITLAMPVRGRYWEEKVQKHSRTGSEILAEA